jgi:aspartate/methionine/tyrosine aminotransferase
MQEQDGKLEETTGAGETAFREVPRTGVIYVMAEARARGYGSDGLDWTNFGQGMPETGPLPGAPPRLSRIEIDPDDHEYAPVQGVGELRQAVADYYNRTYRAGKASQYTAENVCICPGGRTALTRVAAALGRITLGHMLPDYTAYEELLDIFRLFSPIPILLDPDRGYDFSLDELRREILGRGLSALLISNPCNPTGKVISGENLRGWVSIARRTDCALILDEFYSHYIWRSDEEEDDDAAPTVSAARHVEDVERDPVLIINGLTKNWRYPGWRLAWAVGPRDIVERLSSAASFLDGGASRPLQRAAIQILEAEGQEAEVRALQRAFGAKRDAMLSRLTSMGIHVERPPQGTFYIWGNVRNLPAPLSDGMRFFRACLERRIICVPGVFFDVNPGQRRAARPSRFRHHVRFSFGPQRASLEAGLDRLEALIQDAEQGKL